MICPDCKAAAAKVCADHHRTTNIEDDADATIAQLERDLELLRDASATAIVRAVREEREACALEADKYRHWPCTAIAAGIRARGGGA